MVLALFGAGCVSSNGISCQEPVIPASQAQLKICGKSRYQIVYPELPKDAPRIAIYAKAAAMLRQALYEGVGIDAPIRSEAKALKGCKTIYIGDTKAARAAGIKVEDHPNFGFV
ncbi:MAG: hypothetical protein J6S54_07985, partial [Lentisphaeria bacterium]|nr:hypothetical protein [Lentisphaeria bacterium]